VNQLKTNPLFLFATLLTVSPPAIAAELGDPAPPLKIADWVKGKLSPGCILAIRSTPF